jgi:hypothetical protein
VSGPLYADGDRVIVSDTPVDSSDKKYSGKVGTVERKEHTNGGRSVYRVQLDGADYSVLFYDADLLPYDDLAVLKVQLAEAENQVVVLREAIRLKERDAESLPVATVVSYKDTFGPAVITKQMVDVWLNVFPTQSGNPNTEILNDDRVTQLLTNNAEAVVRKP